MAKNNIIFQGSIEQISDAQEGQKIYSDLVSWQDSKDDQEFNNWETSPGSESARITLRIVDVDDDDLPTRKTDIRDQLDQINTDYGTDYTINRFQAVEI
jgi:hypothetical protein